MPKSRKRNKRAVNAARKRVRNRLAKSRRTEAKAKEGPPNQLSAQVGDSVSCAAET